MGENSCELVESVEKCFINCSQVLRIKGSNYPTPKILRKKLLQIATKHRNLQKFSPSKVFHYTVCMTHNKPHLPEKKTGLYGMQRHSLHRGYLSQYKALSACN